MRRAVIVCDRDVDGTTSQNSAAAIDSSAFGDETVALGFKALQNRQGAKQVVPLDQHGCPFADHMKRIGR